MNNFFSVFQNPYIPYCKNRSIVIVAIILGIIEYSRLLGFIPFQIEYYLAIPLLLLSLFVCGWKDKFRCNKWYILFLIYIPFNIVLASPSPIFQSQTRYILFLVVFIIVSPIFENFKFRLLRFQLYKILTFIAVPLCCLTVPCYILGINFFKSQYGEIDYSVSVGGFSGLYNHSMILGPICAISTNTLVWYWSRSSRKGLTLFLALLCACGTLLSASRAAVGGMVLGCLVTLIYDRVSKKIRTKRLLYLFLILGLSFPIWQNALYGISVKNENSSELGEYGSRTVKFYSRISEFVSSPVYGVGFASIDPKGDDYYNAETGVIEPGSSWLALLSMTGVCGFLLVLSFYISAYRILLNTKSIYSNLFLGLISIFSFHLLFEGYILAGGSVLFFIFWLILGIATDLKYAKI